MTDDNEHRVWGTWGEHDQERMLTEGVAVKKTREPSLVSEITATRTRQWLSAETVSNEIVETTTIHTTGVDFT